MSADAPSLFSNALATKPVCEHEAQSARSKIVVSHSSHPAAAALVLVTGSRNRKSARTERMARVVSVQCPDLSRANTAPCARTPLCKPPCASNPAISKENGVVSVCPRLIRGAAIAVLTSPRANDKQNSRIPYVGGTGAFASKVASIWQTHFFFVPPKSA